MPIWPVLTRRLRKDLFPAKRIWRKVQDAKHGQLEFCRGGEARMVFPGILHSVVWSCASWLMILVSREELNAHLTLHKHIGNFVISRDDILSFAFEGVFACVIFLNLILGLWMVFGSIRVTIDKNTGLITKSYRLLAVPVFERRYEIRRASYVSFESPTILARMLHAYFVFLQTEGQPPQKLFVYLGSPLHKQGREMANEIATFLAVPGPG